MRSLRGRLLAYGALVALTSLAVLVAVALRGTRVEVRELLAPGRGAPVAPLAQALSARLAEVSGSVQGGPELTSLASLLAAVRDQGGETRQLLVVASDGTLLAAAPPFATVPRIERLAAGHVRLTADNGHGQEQVLEVMAPAGGVRDAHGGELGTLLALPAIEPLRSPPAADPGRLTAALGRWLLLGAAVAVAVALPLGLLLARRTTRPLEALTAAARRLRAGDLGQRVAVTGADELAELAQAFNTMAADLERAEASRRRMVADVAHELRTPLARLRVQLEAVEDGLLADGRALVGALQDDVVLLARLVSDLQDLALADAQRLTLRPETVEVSALLARVGTAHVASAERASVTLRADCPPGLAVTADPERLGQVLGNLLDNALAWTPAGGTVTLGARRVDAAVELVVTDTGPGIPPEHLPHVFEHFYRADPSRTRDGRGGAGIGLAVVRALVGAHGGEVWAENAAGGGARFTVRLPAPVLTGS